MIYQYYIFEVRQSHAGEYEHDVHWAYDTDPDMARLKAESQYHTILAAAALSNTAMHSASLLAADGRVLLNQFYNHAPGAGDDE